LQASKKESNLIAGLEKLRLDAVNLETKLATAQTDAASLTQQLARQRELTAAADLEAAKLRTQLEAEAKAHQLIANRRKKMSREVDPEPPVAREVAFHEERKQIFESVRIEQSAEQSLVPPMPTQFLRSGSVSSSRSSNRDEDFSIYQNAPIADLVSDEVFSVPAW
jgi:regulator of replication initiation timing